MTEVDVNELLPVMFGDFNSRSIPGVGKLEEEDGEICHSSTGTLPLEDVGHRGGEVDSDARVVDSSLPLLEQTQGLSTGRVLDEAVVRAQACKVSTLVDEGVGGSSTKIQAVAVGEALPSELGVGHGGSTGQPHLLQNVNGLG
ncbi:hypothetical protein Dimus_008561 [Dionaea muscipula]